MSTIMFLYVLKELYKACLINTLWLKLSYRRGQTWPSTPSYSFVISTDTRLAVQHVDQRLLFFFFFSFIDSSSWVLLSVNYKHVSNSDWHCEGPSALRCKDVRAHNSRHGFVRINSCFSLKKWTKTSHIEVEVLTNPALRGRLRARAAATRTDSMLVSYEVCPAPGEEREGWRTRQQIVERSPQPGSTSK